MIVVITVLIVVVAKYSRAWSLGGRGIRVDGWFVLVVNLGYVGVTRLGYISYEVENVALIVVSFILGSLGVALCVNELLYLLRWKVLMNRLCMLWRL